MSAQVKIQYLDNTTRYEKLRTVESLISRLYAEWVIRGVLAKMLPAQEGMQRLQFHPLVRSAQTDSEFPPAEIHGLKFRLKGKVRWDGGPAREWLKAGCPDGRL